MSNNTNRYIIISAAIFCLSCGTLFAFFVRNKAAEQQQQLSERINLALRRTAHLLLKQAGDSTSLIPAVAQTQENVYGVKLQKDFNYDSLPYFLQNSFEAYGIPDKYIVAISDCQNEQLILGYTSIDFLKKDGSVPCSGRDRKEACMNFTVTFTDPSVKPVDLTYLWFILGGMFVLSIATFGYVKKNKKNEDVVLSNNKTEAPEQPTETHLIYIGKTIFDTHNQTILTENIEQKLTFQESKLFLLFCQHQNELLDRDFILKAIWNDDGVLVSRSVDVFISRLRKLLKPDDTLKIVNVHSRGYRLETSNLS